MLNISFKQFRCWEKLFLEIPLGYITLIKGNSGSGKTTILHGIIWCLYGNIRLVTPNHIENSSKIRTQVTISMPYIFNGINGILNINRLKNPNQLILDHNNTFYEDKVAQSIINNLFGPYDVWISSCYIGQG